MAKAKRETVAKQTKKETVKLSKDNAVQRYRESVVYVYDSKSNAVNVTSKVFSKKDNKYNEHSFRITSQHIKALQERLQDKDNKRFYSYINAELQMLQVLHCDSKAKRANECVNTQYDSRKQLAKILLHIAMNEQQQTAKKAKRTAKQQA